MSDKHLPPAQVYAPGGYPAPAYHQGHGQPAPAYHQGAPQYQQPAIQNNTTFAPVTSQATSQNTNVVLNMGGKGAKKREWSTQFCGCMEDVGTCFCAMCCTTCMLCAMSTRLGEFVFMPFCVPQAIMAMRIKIREANKIKGTICEDFCITSCCPLISLCQMKRELDNIDKRIPATEL